MPPPITPHSSAVATTLAEMLRHFGADYLRTRGVSAAQARAWRVLVACRTPALGGQQLRCNGRGAQQWRWHSCCNRHCPQCQTRQRDAWREARLGELLAVRYYHLVLILPHELNALAAVHPRWVYDTLMQFTAATLNEFAANERWLGGIGAFTLVLHTWTQDLRRHLHVHALMALRGVAVRLRWSIGLALATALKALPVPGACPVQDVQGQIRAGCVFRKSVTGRFGTLGR